MRKNVLLAARLSLLLGSTPLLAQAAVAELPALGADLTRSSVSGISSGGFMAAQLATAYSATFIGVGVIAAGPYYCAGTHPKLSLIANATATCMSPASVSVAADAAVSWQHAQAFAAAGQIDPVENLARQRVYVFSGTEDRTVKTMVSDQVAPYYRLAKAKDTQILYRKDIKAGHSIVTDRTGDVACATTAAPYINNCGFSQARELLSHIYGVDSAEPAAAAGGRIIAFKQSEFVKGSRASMDDIAYVYVPAACEKDTCAVHVALHGCQQGASNIQDRFYRGTGYNEFADTNHLIVLYPQAVASTMPPNPKGCWDFWGYSSEDQKKPTFYARNAPQMSAIYRMVQRLGQPRSDKSTNP
jgi:poly(3-hydroxybutyrate) depolymerase